MKPDPILFAQDSLGVYIPKYFAKSIRRDRVTGISDESFAILEAGPDHENYWDCWDEILDWAEVTDDRGHKYSLHQDGDLWLIPEGMIQNGRGEWEWPFEGESFTGPACWACYLINGDASGLSDEEQAECDRAAEGLGFCVDAIDVGFINRPDYGLAGDCCEYRFQK